VLLLGCGGGERPERSALEASTTKVEISALAGGGALRCVFSAPGLELCTWRLAEGDPAWAPLASAAGSDGELNLVCELPIDGSPRSGESCRVHPRAAQAATGEADLPPVGAAGLVEGRGEAERKLAEAVTVRELSHLVGDAPDRCRTGAGVQTCEWSLAEGSAGYGLLAALVDDAGSGESVQLRCALPLDGAARAADSCGVAWTE
jgi:hypothetical protein